MTIKEEDEAYGIKGLKLELGLTIDLKINHV